MDVNEPICENALAITKCHANRAFYLLRLQSSHTHKMYVELGEKNTKQQLRQVSIGTEWLHNKEVFIMFPMPNARANLNGYKVQLDPNMMLVAWMIS